MSDIAAMIAEFHALLGQRYGDGGDPELRRKLHLEEGKELIDAIDAGDRVWIAQELADVVYVAYGTAYSLGIDLDAVIAEVHRANLSKFTSDGRALVRADGKVLKGDAYSPPDVAGVLAAVGEAKTETGAGTYCCADCGSQDPLADAVAEIVHEWGMSIPADRYGGTTSENATVRVKVDEAMDLAQRAYELGQGGAR